LLGWNGGESDSLRRQNAELSGETRRRTGRGDGSRDGGVVVAPLGKYKCLAGGTNIKVELSISYLRQSFWPLREFKDLHDVNRQVPQWLVEGANQRLHRETRERPAERFKPEALGPSPIIPYDYRDTVEALVHKDLRLQFDGNKYCVPHRYVGKRLTVKADAGAVTYERVSEVVS
jgi:hypothetical protein